VIGASYFQKTVILCVLDQPHQFQRDCGALQLVMFVLPTNTTCTAANLFLTRVSKSILLALNQYRALRSSHGERLHPASPANNTQDDGEEPGEGDNAAKSREGRADEIKDEDGHCGEEGGEGRA